MKALSSPAKVEALLGVSPALVFRVQGFLSKRGVATVVLIRKQLLLLLCGDQESAGGRKRCHISGSVRVCRSDSIEGLVIVRHMATASNEGCMGVKPLLLLTLPL